MRNAFLHVYVKAQLLTEKLRDERGQDLVEYALVLALVALGATTALGLLSGSIGTAMGNVGTKLAAAIPAA